MCSNGKSIVNTRAYSIIRKSFCYDVCDGVQMTYCNQVDFSWTAKVVQHVCWWKNILLVMFKMLGIHHDVIKWKHFPRYWPFCAGISPVTGEFPSQRPVTRSFDAVFDLHLNKRLSKQSWGWWFETPSRSLWRHRNDVPRNMYIAHTLPCCFVVRYQSMLFFSVIIYWLIELFRKTG